MRLEDLKQEFPQMPDDLRNMVEHEVRRQLRESVTGNKRKYTKHTIRRSLIVAFAAAMLLGTTVFAAIAYHMRSESVGKYAVKTKIEKDENNSLENGHIPNIPDVTMEVSYLPDGMVKTEDGKYSFENAMYKGGVSIVFYKMDTGDAAFEMLTKNVKETENISVGGHEGVYFALQSIGGEDISFNQRIYVAYPDVHYVMELYAASDVSKEEAIKIAEGIRLQPVSDNALSDAIAAYKWSDFLASNHEEVVEDAAPAVSGEEMKNTHAIGDVFAANPQKEDLEGLGNVEIKVSDVQVSDNISLLDLSALDEDFKAELQSETTPSGELLPAKINYMKFGDGVNSVDTVVESREVPQKLIYATVEYTNKGTEELEELLFFGSLMKFAEENGQIKRYDGKTFGPSADWDDAVLTGAARHVEMWYYDVHGGERNNNYITHLKAGETATVHMAWLVPEEELAYLYLNLDSYGDSYNLCDHSLEVGYVDIRQ